MDSSGNSESGGYGIAISGGGHRATAWGLGGLLYFVESGANKDVKAISSVSGGSLTNAFVATRGGSFKDISGTDKKKSFSDDVAKLAREISGRPWVWWTFLIGYVVAWSIGIWFMIRLGFSGLGPAAAVSGGWLVLAWRLGPFARGTLWSSPLMWLYLGVLGPGLILSYAVWWLPPSWEWRLAIFVGASLGWLTVFLLRGAIAGFAFARSVCNPRQDPVSKRRLKGLRRSRLLKDIENEVQHVFCATEMHAGQHAYFSADFVYSQGFGIGIPGDLPLHTAVQASANFPGGFPLRLLSARTFDFALGREQKRNRFLVLTDGGVFDNMADAWFLDLKLRMTYLLERLRDLRHVTKPDQPAMMRGHEVELNQRLKKLEARFVSPLPGMASGEGTGSDRKATSLIVLNGAPSVRWARLNRVWMPGLGEVLGFTKVAKVQYNNSTSTRGRDLIQRFVGNNPPGALVTIEEDPAWVPLKYIGECLLIAENSLEQERKKTLDVKGRTRVVRREEELDKVAALLGPTGSLKGALEILDSFRPEAIDTDRVERACDKIHLPQDKKELLVRAIKAVAYLEDEVLKVPSPPPHHDLRSLSLANRVIRTHLNPLGKEKTARLLFHAYLQSMVTLYVIFGAPFTLKEGQEKPTMARFRAMLEKPNGKAESTQRQLLDWS